jgi:hypothetical protein
MGTWRENVGEDPGTARRAWRFEIHIKEQVEIAYNDDTLYLVNMGLD